MRNKHLLLVFVAMLGLAFVYPTSLSAQKDKKKKDAIINDGVLYCSGMIAGEGLVGILLAVLAVFGVSDRINLGLMGFHLGKWGGCLFFLALLFSMIYMIHKTKDKQSSNNTL